MKYSFANRDISWLQFNGRVMQQAADDQVPLLERFRFLSIFSSNLDEFYRVRMPLLKQEGSSVDADGVLAETNHTIVADAQHTIRKQQEKFGDILCNQLIPAARAAGYQIYYGDHIPEHITQQAKPIFLTRLLPFLQWFYLDNAAMQFKPFNNEQYLLISTTAAGKDELVVMSIKYPETGRLILIKDNETGTNHILFAEDLIKAHVKHVLGDVQVNYALSVKITNDAELEMENDLRIDDFESISRKIKKRELGKVSRILYDPAIPKADLMRLVWAIGANDNALVSGGQYHHLRDLAQLPLDTAAGMCYTPLLPVKGDAIEGDYFEWLEKKDRWFSFPYQHYDNLLRFINEAATHRHVISIAISIYRIASGSRMAKALITAAKNGKQVTVFVEVKARFDELNNLYWADQMKDAGIKIVYSIPRWKVHAKIALVGLRKGATTKYFGLLSTGNFNEITANFYTDHALITADANITQELSLLFAGLSLRTDPTNWPVASPFKHLLVAPFNMRGAFYALIDQEISNQLSGKPSGIYVKINNIEDEQMITKLYKASGAGVTINLLVRGICKLVPGVKGQSENIRVRRIVDRFLEHDRVFRFENGGDRKWLAGSADWMKRNLSNRVEVCFPIKDEAICSTLDDLMNLQWPKTFTDNAASSLQMAAYRYLSSKP